MKTIHFYFVIWVSVPTVWRTSKWKKYGCHAILLPDLVNGRSQNVAVQKCESIQWNISFGNFATAILAFSISQEVIDASVFFASRLWWLATIFNGLLFVPSVRLHYQPPPPGGHCFLSGFSSWLQDTKGKLTSHFIGHYLLPDNTFGSDLRGEVCLGLI